jgi:RHS repeat-associated protein
LDARQNRRGAGTNTPTTQAYTGQKRESSFGLYDYNARWYDAALGRFTQADTIVPNPASAKAFDRYAYVENNPINANDPSGHVPACYNRDGRLVGYMVRTACWDNPGGGEVDYSDDSASADSLAAYGVSVFGFSKAELQEVRRAVFRTGSALFHRIKHTFKTNSSLFKFVFGSFSIERVSAGGIPDRSDIDSGCYTSGNIYCVSWYNNELYENLLHEFGHRYDQITGQATEGGSNALGYASITYKASGKTIVVTGNGLGEDGKWERGFEGYRMNKNLRHPYIQNPDLTVGEEWADMFGNWVNRSFATSQGGNARMTWMTNQLQADITKRISEE